MRIAFIARDIMSVVAAPVAAIIYLREGKLKGKNLSIFMYNQNIYCRRNK